MFPRLKPVYELAPEPLPEPDGKLKPGIYRLLGHDFQIGDWWSDEEKNRANRNRSYPEHKGKPETVATYFKDENVYLTKEWQWFHFRQMIYACFGHFDERLLSSDELQAMKRAWASTMAGNRVITNHKGPDNGYADWIQGINLGAQGIGYMGLGMGGNVIELVDETVYRLNLIGNCHKFKTLDGSKPPPDPREVNFLTHPQFFSRATICRYWETTPLPPELKNPWQHVIPFDQFDKWNAHTILLNISKRGENYVPVQRCIPWDSDEIPSPYWPNLKRRTE